MADNYLERKMEEHRMAAAQRRTSALPSKGKILFNFPPKRVIVCGRNEALSKAVIKAFAESGCRVALYSSDPDGDTGGARFIQSTGNPSQDLTKMLQSWGDADIIISTETDTKLEDVINTILSHRQSLPYPNDYGLRFIGINTDTSDNLPECVTCNTIILSAIDNPLLVRQAALTALFLSVPELSGINNSTVKIN